VTVALRLYTRDHWRRLQFIAKDRPTPPGRGRELLRPQLLLSAFPLSAFQFFLEPLNTPGTWARGFTSSTSSFRLHGRSHRRICSYEHNDAYWQISSRTPPYQGPATAIGLIAKKAPLPQPKPECGRGLCAATFWLRKYQAPNTQTRVRVVIRGSPDYRVTVISSGAKKSLTALTFWPFNFSRFNDSRFNESRS